MDTIYVFNKSYFVKLDTVNTRTDFLQITNSIDSLKAQSQTNFKELVHTIEVTQRKENYFKFISNDALFSTITTILIFSLGIIANELIKLYDKSKHKRQIRIFIKEHIDKIQNIFTGNLEKAYTEVSQNTTIDSGINLTPPQILSNDFQRILHVDSKEVFNSIKEKDALSIVISQIDFLSHLIDEVQSYHEIALKRSNDFRDKLNTEINRYMDTLADFVDFEQNNTSDYESALPYQTINNSILKYYNEIAGKRELKKFYDEILRPNQEYLVNSNIFRTHQIGKLIASQGKDISHLFNELQELIKEFKDQYTDFTRMVKDSSKSLSENTNKINWL